MDLLAAAIEGCAARVASAKSSVPGSGTGAGGAAAGTSVPKEEALPTNKFSPPATATLLVRTTVPSGT